MKAWPENYECEGQTDIFDFIKEPEPEILLAPGEHVWKVVRGDILEYEVEDWTYTCGKEKENRGYGLIYIDPEKPDSDVRTYSRAWNTTIGNTVFKSIDEAKKKAAENMKIYEHILASDMHPKKIVAYEIIANGHRNVEWYAELDNDLIYFNYGCMYCHIGTKKEIKEFDKKISSYKELTQYRSMRELKDFEPRFENMYKCKDHENWLYAGARYGYMEI